jgi:cyclophilin family peptidyl-prolyl cis-trans isomerase
VFICLSREGTQRLDGKYTAFAQAVRGADTILAIAATPLIPDKPGEEPKNRPKDPPLLKSARMVDAPPFGAGPAPLTRPEAPPTKR